MNIICTFMDRKYKMLPNILQSDVVEYLYHPYTHTHRHSMKTDSTCRDSSCYQRAASFSFKNMYRCVYRHDATHVLFHTVSGKDNPIILPLFEQSQLTVTEDMRVFSCDFSEIPSPPKKTTPLRIKSCVNGMQTRVGFFSALNRKD